MIFNAVLEHIMRNMKAKWRVKKWGVQLGVGADSVLTNLRFADDILLIGRSLHQIKQMLADVMDEGGKVGLHLHPGKTKIQHNNIGYGSKVRSANIKGVDIEVLDPTAATMYLGRSLSLTDTHDVELKHRLAKAWSKFGMYRQELTDRSIPLHLRLKLFHAVVTPSVLYGSSSWVMTCAREQALRSAQMKMMRTILTRRRSARQPSEAEIAATGETGPVVETWVEWVKRVTREAREAMTTHHIPDWVKVQQESVRRWSWRLHGMESHRWACRVLNWQPDGWRARSHPRTRWLDKSTEVNTLSH